MCKTAVSEAYHFQLVVFGEAPLVPLYKHPFEGVLLPDALHLVVTLWPRELVASKQLLDAFLVSAQVDICKLSIVF